MSKENYYLVLIILRKGKDVILISRGLIISKPKNINNGFKFTIWVTCLIHRYHFPIILLEAIIASVIGLIIKNFTFTLAMIMLMEVFYFSIAFHEACHMSFAKIFDVEVVSVSYKPYTIAGIRTNFSRDRKIAPDDLMAILFAGPALPICIVAFLAIIIKIIFRIIGIDVMQIGVFAVCVMFLYIDLLSLLPIKGTDGQRVYAYILKNPRYLKILFGTIGYYFYVRSGFEKIYDRNNS